MVNSRAEEDARPARPWLVFAALGSGFFLASLDGTVVAVGTPTLQLELDASVGGAVWVTTGYLLAYVAPMLVAGRFGERWGKRRVYLVGLAVFTGASLACGLAPGLEVLIAARVVQGIGAALMAPQALAMVTDTIPPERLGLALGVWSMTAGVASVIGPLLGGLMVAGPGWRWLFLVNVPIGLAVLLATRAVVPRSAHNRASIAVLPGLLSTAAIVLVVVALQELAASAWAWVVLGAGLLLLVGFLLGERHDGSLVPPAIISAPGYLPGVAGVAAAGLVVAAVPLVLMLWAQEVRGIGSLEAALLILPLGIVSAALAPISGIIIDRRGHRPVAIGALVVSALSILVLAVGIRTDAAIAFAVASMALFGVSNSAIWASLSVASFGSLPSTQTAAGSAVYNTVRQLGAAVGSAGVGLLLPWQLARHSADAGVGPEAYSAASATVLVILALAPIAASVYVAVATPRTVPNAKEPACRGK